MADKEEKSLADLEIDQKTSEVESADDTKHEHKHSDELSYKEDPGQIKRTHGLLFSMAMAAFIVVLLGTGYLLLNFEGGTPIVSTPVADNQPTEDTTSLIPLTGAVFFANNGTNANGEFISLADREYKHQFSAKEQGNLTASNGSRNATWQVSRDGKLVAYQIGNNSYVTVENIDEAKNIFSDQTISKINDWLLIPDGSHLVALVTTGGKQQLLDYTFSNGTTATIDGFASGGGFSRLQHGTDGYIRQFSFSGSSLKIAEYKLEDQSYAARTIESPRFPANPQQFSRGLSPDGTTFVYRYQNESLDHIGLVSLNSGVVRAIYKAASASVAVADVIWASDSRTLLMAEAEGGGIKRLRKLDSGPLSSEVLIDANTAELQPASANVARSPAWLNNGQSVAFYSGGTVWLYKLEDKSLISLLSDQSEPSANTVYGWYNRQPSN